MIEFPRQAFDSRFILEGIDKLRKDNFRKVKIGKKTAIRKEKNHLQGVIEGLDNALKNSALRQKENFAEMLEEILKQKKQCAEEINHLEEKLVSLEVKERNFKDALQGEGFKDYAGLLLSNLEKLDPLELKSLIRTLIPKGIIHLGDEVNTLELIYNLDVKTSTRKTGGLTTLLHGKGKILPLFGSKKEGPKEEVKKWPYIQSGGTASNLGQSFFSRPYLSDFIELSRTPSITNKSVLHQKFIIEGLSSHQMAGYFGCSTTTVKKYLREFDIKKKVLTGKSCYNLSFGEKFIKGKIVPCRKERKIIDSIIDMNKKQGLSTCAIAKALNAMKIPKKKRGMKWNHVNVGTILKRWIHTE